MKSTEVIYEEFPDFLGGLPRQAAETLSESRVLFCYPIITSNEYELVEHPVSQRTLMSVCRTAGCSVQSEVARLNNDKVIFTPINETAPTHVVIHPMISTIGHLPSIVTAYRVRFPDAGIVVQNSDQHQHEKLIGGPGSRALAQKLLDDVDDVDWVILGFAEHALLTLIAGEPSASVIGRDGEGKGPEKYFRIGSLPAGALDQGVISDDGSVRIQRSRGCLSPCNYCIEGQANKNSPGEKSWDGVSIDEFVARLRRLTENGYFFINVIDSSFEDPGRRGLSDMRYFCDRIIEEGLRFSFKIHMRAENVMKLSDDDLIAMKNAGIDVIVVGLESGNDAELRFFRKIASVADNEGAWRRLETPHTFCNIFGHMMFSPVVDRDIIVDKLGFLERINRGWDFLNLTNRVLVFWGTVLHRELVEMGLAAYEPVQLGYVSYDFRDPSIASLDTRVNAIKTKRPGFLRLNNLIYDAMNLHARLQNPANAEHLERVGKDFETFGARLQERQSRLNALYIEGFRVFVHDPKYEVFLPDFDVDEEAAHQHAEIMDLLAPLSRQSDIPKTLYLRTWLSNVNRFGVKPATTASV